jgi:predicted  nucleic acid-binding Zn-ribbon protein
MEQFISLIQGPAAATVLMAAILGTAYKFVINYVIPRIDNSLKESNDRYKEMIAEHRSDREAWLKSIDKISERLDKMSEVTDDMAKTVENLHNSVSAITQQLQDARKP